VNCSPGPDLGVFRLFDIDVNLARTPVDAEADPDQKAHAISSE